MAIKWTEKQIKAIEVKGHNTLVSAAAGSGKTTVLVERVIRMVTDNISPVDLDDLLIVTFTRAAAGQMKTKIRRAISEKLKEDPSNAHLLKQFMKVDTANISTIDALCRRLISENSREIDLDPSVKTANEDELMVLRERILEETLEEFYEAADPDFLNLVDSYMERDDSKLKEMVIKLYRFAKSYPWPIRWLSDCAKIYEEPSKDSGWIRELELYSDSVISGIIDEAKALIEICNSEGGPAHYADALTSDIENLSAVLDLDFDGRFKAFNDEDLKFFPKLPGKDPGGSDPLIKARIQDIRKKYKERFSALGKDIYDAPLEGKLKDLNKCAGTALSLLNLTKRFMDNFLSAKLKEGVLDFNDIAHFALDSLVKFDCDGNLVYTESAERTAGHLKEIIVDEYQDTNELQEEIIKALSGARFGKENVYMVGDVKQSIYGFRQTCPELFNKKYNTYTGDSRLILDSNFRSRKKIVDFVNDIFLKSMIPEVGGIDYTDGNELTFGANYEPSDDEPVEVTFIGANSREGRSCLAELIAEKIEDVVSNFMVEEGEGKRPAKYSDIAILYRNSNNPELEKALQRRGIPAEKETGKGFFSALEVRLAKALLYITDNPYQDIEFAAVLHSPLVGLSASELAELKLRGGDAECADESGSLYEICLSSPDLAPALHRKITGFMSLLKDFRSRAVYMDLYDLIEYIFTESGLYNIVLAMPAGEVRMRNLFRLKEMAAEFSSNNHDGLAGFCLNLRKMSEIGLDFGQSSDFAGDSGAVKMMTIHKAKGLEFPIVILADAGRKFNDKDLNDEIIIDRKWGIGLSLRDSENKIKETTIFKEALKTRKKSEEWAEEGRLLYVALTRAMEKLIVFGSYNGLFNKEGEPSSLISEWNLLKEGGIKKLPADKILKYDSYLKLIGASSFSPDAIVKIMPAENLESERVTELRDLAALREALESMAFEGKISSSEDDEVSERGLKDDSSGDLLGELSARLKFEYPHKEASKTPAKRTASGLEKKDPFESCPDDLNILTEDMSDAEFGEYCGILQYDDAEDSDVKFAAAMKGVTRGSAYHRVFELLDYKALASELPELSAANSEINQITAHISDQINKMREQGMLSEEFAELINPEEIAAFIVSDLGRRMIKAALRGNLFRERQFVKGDTVLIDGEEETLLMQGAIDAYFIEWCSDPREERIILVDYKTDRGKSPEELMEMYLPQQLEYKDALERAVGLPVKEMYLYSTSLRSAILLPENNFRAPLKTP